MKKASLKRFSVQARKKIVDAVQKKAYALGIAANDISPLKEPSEGLLVNGTMMGEAEKKQYSRLISRILSKGYEHVMEEAAYTWFVWFISIRYMEVNGFLPIQMRALSSETLGKLEPDALTKVLEISDELEMDQERVHNLRAANHDNELYQYLLTALLNKLSKILPNVFAPFADEMMLLMPDNLLSETNILYDIVTIIPEEDWQNIEIIGWLYQFYISEEKDAVFSRLRKNQKIGKGDIASATQLFTPKWIVQYMVDNSLGRLWLESHPDEALKETFTYYIDDAEQTAEVVQQLEDLKDSSLDVEEIKFLDPSCGSGHILVYAFEVFYHIYLSRGYRPQEIPKLILEKNLYGLDIDKRVTQLAIFAVFMKAREYDSHLFKRDIKVHIYSIEESNTITTDDIELFAKGDKDLQTETGKLVAVFEDAKLYGAIIQVPSVDIESIRKQMAFLRKESDLDIFTTELIEYTFPVLEDLINQYEAMAMQYEVVVTNPPYMGTRGMDPKLSAYVKKHYKDEKSDLFAVFMEVTKNFTRDHYYTAAINQHSWMFLSSYEKLREKLLGEQTILNMVHLGTRTFEEIGGEVVQNTAFVLRKSAVPDYNATYIRMTDIPNALEKKQNFHNMSLRHQTKQRNFEKIPSSPIAYWATDQIVRVFEKGQKLEEIASPRQGLATGNNDEFLRLWFEINNEQMGTGMESTQAFQEAGFRYAPYNKGGSFRKWYGNFEYVIKFDRDNYEFLAHRGNHLPSRKFYFMESITWSFVSSRYFGVRYSPTGSVFDVGGSSIFPPEELIFYLVGLLTSKVSTLFMNMFNPTMNFQVGDIKKIPVIQSTEWKETIEEIVQENIQLSKKDWDAFETSWDFEKHPFLTYKEDASLVKDSFAHWKQAAEERFTQLKDNEEKLNQIFIDIYELQDELTPEVEEKDITVRKADLQRDVKSFLSYLVGVMFGRYSLDQKGLAYAGGEWDQSLYSSYQPDENNILPITEEAYFEDDIVKKVEELVALIYGEETLEENLAFIADALKRKKNESARDRIRRYFTKEFYKDHVKTYQKRPIYWQFTSGRRGAFKGLIYLHRYNRDTLGRLRTKYILKESTVLDNLMNLEQNTIGDPGISTSEKAAAQKRLENSQKDKDELAKYDLVLNHMAKRRIELDLDDGVKVNYAKFRDIEVMDNQIGKTMRIHLLDKV